MVFPTAQRSAAAKTKPTVYIDIIRENDPIDKAIEKAYGESFTFVQVRNSKEFNRAMLRKAVDPHVVLSGSPQGNGEVVVATIVTTDGRATEPVILKSADKRLNAAMLDAVKQFRYTPARFNGSPVSVANTITFSKETALSQTSSHVVLSESQQAQLGLYTPKPNYPLEARRRHITGQGAFKLYVDVSTGLVRSIQVLQSTGSGILDAAATNTLKQWRLKPDVLRRYREAATQDKVIFRVPVTFALTR